MSNDAPATSVTESATCAPTSNLRKRCCRTLPAVPRPPSFSASTISARELCSAGYKPITRPVSSESAIVNASTGNESAVALPASIGRKFAASLRYERDQLPGEERAENSREQAEQHAFENEKPQHARARRAQRHAQRNLATSPAEPNE